MSRAPFVVICIDGYNAPEMGRTIHAFMDIPCVGIHTPPAPLYHATVLRETKRLYAYLPGIIMAPSLVSTIKSKEQFERLPWKELYDPDRTLFITLKENILAEMKTEGSEFLRPIMDTRFQAQKRFISLSCMLGRSGYRTKMIDDIGSTMDIAHQIISEVRLTQRNILEIRRDSQSVDG